MSVLVVRHGLSEANNRENIGTLAFGASDAPLMEKGRAQAQAAGRLLREQYALDTEDTVAVSTYLRTRETATHAGFVHQVQYAELSEVDSGLPRLELKAMLNRNEVPDAAVARAELLLAGELPEQQVWFTHGLVIAGLCKVLNVYTDMYKPGFTEIRELPL